MNIAVLFPGQGSQFVGMGKKMADAFPSAASIFNEANQILGFSLSELIWNGPEEELRATINAQPAIVATSLACWSVLNNHGIIPAYVAGHSVGEYAALAASGVFSYSEAIKLVRKRGECMYACGIQRPGTMAAVLGLDFSSVEEVCQNVSSENNGSSFLLEIANLNAPGQIVVSGDKTAVDKSIAIFMERGAKKVVKLSVSGAFHSGLMEEAKTKFDPVLDATKFNDGKILLVSNVTASPLQDGSQIKETMKQQIRKPVRWEELVQYMINKDVSIMLEVGAGQVLSGLVKKINRKIKVYSIQDPQSLSEALKGLKWEF